MIIYEVKIKIEETVEQEWLQWMRDIHAPDVVATGYAQSFQILKPLEDEPLTYYFQYHFDSKAAFDTYVAECAPALKADVLERYPNRFTASRRLYTII